MKVMTAKIVIQSKMPNYDEENDIIKQLHYIIRGICVKLLLIATDKINAHLPENILQTIDGINLKLQKILNYNSFRHIVVKMMTIVIYLEIINLLRFAYMIIFDVQLA